MSCLEVFQFFYFLFKSCRFNFIVTCIEPGLILSQYKGKVRCDYCSAEPAVEPICLIAVYAFIVLMTGLRHILRHTVPEDKVPSIASNIAASYIAIEEMLA